MAKKRKSTKKRSPAQIAATKRMLAGLKASKGKGGGKRRKGKKRSRMAATPATGNVRKKRRRSKKKRTAAQVEATKRMLAVRNSGSGYSPRGSRSHYTVPQAQFDSGMKRKGKKSGKPEFF